MESPGAPEKDDGIIRINRIEPGHIDVVLGSHPGRGLPRPLREPRPYGLILLCAVLAILSICLMLSQLRRHASDIAPAIAPTAAVSKPDGVTPVAAPQLPDTSLAAPGSSLPDAQD